MLKRSFLRSIEVIGEAAKNVPESFRKESPELQWRDMAGMRDRLIHAYFSVDWEDCLERDNSGDTGEQAAG